MNEVIYTSPHKHVDADGDECSFRIRQVEEFDCIVEFSMDGTIWDASEDDSMCSWIYMEALLAGRSKSKVDEAFLSMKTSIEDNQSQTDCRVTKKMVKEVVRHFTEGCDPEVKRAKNEIRDRLFGIFGLT